MRILSAPPLLLEPLCAAHAGDMFAVLSDPALYEFENEPPASVDALERRYRRLETRQSDDGRQVWLNWVVRLASGALAGHVQATVLPSGRAYVAYELASAHWRQGLGTAAVSAMLRELEAHYGVTTFVAVLKARNFRSLALLRKLDFVAATAEESLQSGAEPDECVWVRQATRPPEAERIPAA